MSFGDHFGPHFGPRTELELQLEREFGFAFELELGFETASEDVGEHSGTLTERELEDEPANSLLRTPTLRTRARPRIQSLTELPLHSSQVYVPLECIMYSAVGGIDSRRGLGCG